MSKLWLLLISLVGAIASSVTPAAGQSTTRYDGPIIDVHLHAYLPQAYPQTANRVTERPPVSRTAEEHMRATLDSMDEHNIVVGFVSGPLEAVQHGGSSHRNGLWEARPSAVQAWSLLKNLGHALRTAA